MTTVHIDPLFVIETYSHFFKVTRVQTLGQKFLELFLVKYIHKTFRQQTQYNNPFAKITPPDDKVYGLKTKKGLEYRFHIGQLAHLERYLKDSGYDRGFYKVIEVEQCTPEPLRCSLDPKWQLRDRQPEVVDFLLTPMDDDNRSRLVTLPTGYGKGLISLKSMTERGFRVAYILLPKYIEKTRVEILEKTNAKEKDVMVIRGSDSLRGLIELGKEKTYKSDFILISISTWMNFVNSYLENPRICAEDEYGCKPEELFNLLGIGTVCIDEIHEHLHAVYRTFCFMHTNLAIGLSATFLSKDPMIDNIQQMMFPREIRFEEVKVPPYIRAYGISYVINSDSLRHIRTSSRGSSTYSQSEFEKSILKNKALTHKFLLLVQEVFENGFMDQYKPGHKCIIYFRSVNMCERVRAYLSMKFPELDIRKYTEEDPYENVIDPAVRITTHQSAGTAIDIAGLMTNITFDNINEPKANLQCLGRLRKPAEGVARYYSVYSENIRQHVKYAVDRKELFLSREKVLTFKDFRSRVAL